MLAQIESARPQIIRCNMQRPHTALPNLVLVGSESSRGLDCGGPGVRGLVETKEARQAIAGPNGFRCTQIAASTLSCSAAWCRRRSRDIQVSPRFNDPIGAAPGRTADLPESMSEILQLLCTEETSWGDREAIAGAIATLRNGDAVIVGPLSPDDANSPGLLPHLADLARGAYRALRPPRELIVHPAFSQVARRFQFIQMSHQEARALGAGAGDIGILAQRLRRLQGDPGEFAITAFTGRGLLWADDAWWEIEPIECEAQNESVAAAVFCLAWVVARRFRGDDATQALAFACGAAAAAVSPGRQKRTRLPWS
jgi:hypothetical protein